MGRYSLDKTGLNPDNLVCEDVVDIGDKAVRIIAPRYGAFFSASLKVWDGDRLLDIDVDYKPEEFLQEESMLTAQEIVRFIAIINPEVSSTIKVHRQVLGGNYASYNDVAGDAFEQAANDLRPVHFNDLLGVPEEWNPAWHTHSAPSVLDWGALVAAIDRLRGTVNIGNTASFQTLVDYIDKSIRIAKREFEEQHLAPDRVFDGFIDERGMSMSSILYMLTTNNIPSVIFLKPIRSEFVCGNQTGIVYLELFSNKPCKDMKLRWDVEHYSTDESDFLSTKGALDNYKSGSVLEIIINNELAFRSKYFEVSISIGDKRVSLMMGKIRASDYVRDVAEVENSYLQEPVETAETHFLSH